MYHSISTHAKPRFQTYVTHPEMFADHMSALLDNGYHPVGLKRRTGDVASSIGAERRVVITFDDAFLDFHTEVLPILAEHRIEATVFVPTAYVGGSSRWLAREGEDDRPMMSWSALQEAADTGVTLGSHSRTHPQLDLLSKDVVRTETLDSKAELEDRVQQRVDAFAYPFGYHNRTVRSAIRAAGYTHACAVRDLSDASSDDYCISRWTMRHGMTAAELLELLEVVRTGPVARLRSSARSQASWFLRRTGVKSRGSAVSRSST